MRRCRHDWNKWGEPYQSSANVVEDSFNYHIIHIDRTTVRQNRKCKKCGKVESVVVYLGTLKESQ